MFIFALSSFSYALDLFEAYNKAKAHDPQYLSVYYEHRANLTLTEQATSRVLPQINASYTLSNYRFITGEAFYRDYSSEQTNISMQQAVFNLPSIIEIKQSNVRVRASESRLKNAEQNLIKRVAEAYFDLLYAEEYLRAVSYTHLTLPTKRIV